MDQTRLLEITRAILEEPTAPFHEELVRAKIEELLAPLPHVEVERDGFGNVLARYRRGAALSRFAFAAHMDHPGYVGDKFFGWVGESYLAPKPPTRAFDGFAMWDLPPCEVRDGRIYSRACDDLISCAVLVALLEELEQTGAEAACDALFTRAEEVGFVGAMQLALSGRLSKELTVVSLETSSERGGLVKMGDGVILRVGDRTSIFDSVATAQLEQIAKSAALPHQRALMSGGTCEATAYQLYGYRTAGLCVALGNYHNCGPDTTIVAEFVSVSDVEGMHQLCVAAARASDLPDPHVALRARLEAQMAEYTPHF